MSLKMKIALVKEAKKIVWKEEVRLILYSIGLNFKLSAL